jgi:protein-arginine kinase activator protein McsA
VKPATHHITTIVHGKAEQAHLCGECFEKTQSALVRKQMEALMNGTCIYCGAKAAASLDSLGSLIGQDNERFACHECFQEHQAYFLKRLNALSEVGEEAPGDEGMQQIRALRDETDAHMRRWISQKLN